MLKVKRLRDSAIIPSRATDGSAGFDCYACIGDPKVVRAGACEFIQLGIAIGLPTGYVGMLVPSSGLTLAYGITLASSPGIVDEDYSGELVALLRNEGIADFIVHRGMRVCQLIIAPYLHCAVIEELELNDTARGTIGF